MWLPLSSHFLVTTLILTSLHLYSVCGVQDESQSNAKGPFEKTKLRHSRHQRTAHGPSPENYYDTYPSQPSYYTGLTSISNYGGVSNHAEGNGSLTVADNHKPIFKNCSSYQPTVKEEQPTGTFVIQVQAVDYDPPDHGGKINYSFVSSAKERIKFTIDPETGKIHTKTMLDWDEPSREKEIYVTVRATDNGRPQLDDTCTFKIIVEDINDNPPTFDKVSYEESVPQDLKPGSEVMRISATDIDDGKNSVILYSLVESATSQEKYFRINNETGIVFLNKEIDKPPGFRFKIKASATDQSEEPKSSEVELVITVVESDKKAPYFTLTPNSPIHLPENFNNFTQNIATYMAVPNTDENETVFTLVRGRTEQTNSENTFHLYTEKNTAYVRLAEPLDYEKLEKYDLTVRIQNKYKLAAFHSLTILVDDVNDNFPKFTKHISSGSVLENEPPGTPVMQVGAVDADKTPAFSKITYELEDNEKYFDIDPYTGNITTKVFFDREIKDVYNVKVSARDGAPSSHTNDGEPNKATQVFSIEIADKNDHAPVFTKRKYEAIDIPEDASVNSLVTEVKAEDEDSASTITYSIIDGNVNDAFFIEPETGKIKVKNRLDYETVTNYTLKVRAHDGLYQDLCDVDIRLQNVNDNPPVFMNFVHQTTIHEEELETRCLIQVRAYDPDIADRNAPQNIVYYVVKENQQKFFSIDKDGCLSLVKPLDRDPPHGYETWQVLIGASDDGGPSNPHSLRSTDEILINLIDINDNSPYLSMGSDYVIWRENQNPGEITKLHASDNDGPTNGPPFTFELAASASADIRRGFEIRDSALHALEVFDREKQKEYLIPILITDSGKPPRSDVSILRVIIGDENDNEMKEGYSAIFVYYFEGATHDTEIGRVYVDDPDDWDLADKRFEWKDYESFRQYFSLNQFTGMITMSHGVPSQSYLLEFKVTEDPSRSSNAFASHSVSATVNVTIKEIPEEAVDKSGSIRFEGITAEEFVTKNENGESKADILRTQLALALNNSEENVDVFTILHSPVSGNTSQLDVRFSAHGSPYYYPERINSAVTNHQDEMERALGLRMLQINVNECLLEKVFCESSCTNELKKSNVSAPVYTNTTSFIGINAYVQPVCECRPVKQFCLNGGSVGPNGGCICPDMYEGPNCEHTSIGFSGEGWALYPTFEACSDVHLTVYVRATQKDSLIFYIGPESVRPSAIGVEDFMSLELRRGYPVLLINYGTGTTKIEHSYKSIVDDGLHKIEIILSTTSIEMIVDDCRLQKCLGLSTPVGSNKFLNVNGPLQVGGTYMDLTQVGLHRNWTHKPFANGFSGCIKNLTFNEKLYNLGVPSLAHNADPGCARSIAESITFRFDWTFLAAILICLAILTILLMAVAVHRRKVEDMYKDTDDIRENIINYEDEGGGEGDMTGYDLNVLRLQDYDPIADDKYGNRMLPTTGMDEVPDICGFLDGKKHAVDNDPETLPFDDVRHYAYEGDGNTTGSLSSLASGTDEGDLNFDYLSNFGPRFRKLADMYGEDASDEDSDTYHNTASVSWC